MGDEIAGLGAVHGALRRAHHSGKMAERPSALLNLATTFAGIRGAVTLAGALSVPILLAKWNDVLTMVDEKLGKKKAVELPEDWAHQLPPQRVQEKKTRKTAIETDVIPPQTTLPEDEEDYRPLDEVLEELRGK